MIVRKFSGILCANLHDVTRCQLRICQGREVSVVIDSEIKLEKLRSKDGSAVRLPIEKQRSKNGKTVRLECNMNLYVHIKYLDKGGSVVHHQTTWYLSI